MPPRVGQALREARTQRGIALNDVERVTGIRVQYLRALEEERWSQLPGHAETRKVLSAYARYLDLDESSLVEDYEGSRQRPRRPRPVPAGVVRPPGRSRERSRRPFVVATAAAVVILLGIALVAALGSNGGGGNEGKSSSAAKRPGSGQTTTSTTAMSEASIELRATADVWVCLAKAGGSLPVNGETLAAGEERGPFAGRSFEMTFGNGSIELTLNGDPVKVPPLAEPLGFRVTADSARRLAPGAGPTCS